MAEEGCYRRLLDWYYAHEGPLPLNKRELNKIGRCMTPQDRKTLIKVIDEFFVAADDGFHQLRADRIIEKFKKGRPQTTEARENVRDRKRLSREYRAALFEKCKEIGLSPSYNATNPELIDMLSTANVTAPSRMEVTARVVTAWSRDGGHGYPEPKEPNKEKKEEQSATSARREHAREACAAMRVAGLRDTDDESDSLGRALLDGITTEELASAAAEAAARGKGFAYAIAMARGRRADRDHKAAPRPSNARLTAEEERVKAWVPAVAIKSLSDRLNASTVTSADPYGMALLDDKTSSPS
jgi:uncharacterized protein YdaU (DUF1376 family)